MCDTEHDRPSDDELSFSIDKAAFGKFLAELRRAAGYTQKELAEKLFVSDKAVSKWERGLSMPDISLLIPLSKILQVSVTELLEGKRILQEDERDAARIETLVKKALTLSDEAPWKKREKLKKHLLIFAGGTLFSAAELTAGIWLLHRAGILALSSGMLVMELLSYVFGIYFWFFMKERLPAYYDEYEISAYSDGVFRINLPGNVRFNNSNWPHLVKSLRRWSILTLLIVPLLCILVSALPGFWLSFAVQQGMLVAYLCGLFVPLYVLAKKYQ